MGDVQIYIIIYPLTKGNKRGIDRTADGYDGMMNYDRKNIHHLQGEAETLLSVSTKECIFKAEIRLVGGFRVACDVAISFLFYRFERPFQLF